MSDSSLRPGDALGGDAGPTGRATTALTLRVVRRSSATFLGAVATLFVISAITFAGTNIRSPEDIARAAIGRDRTPEQLEAFVEANDLDGPLVVRYGEWMVDFVTGDWGDSLLTREPIRPDLLARLGRSGAVALLSVAVAFPFSVWLGFRQARRRGSRFDVSTNTGLVLVSALPEFVIAIACLWIFSIRLDVLPVDSSGITFGGFLDSLEAYVLPVLTLAIVLVPQFARMARVAAVDVMNTPYVRAAVLRGLPPRRILIAHVLPNTTGPLVNTVAVNLVWLLGGVIVVENVFAFPGIGQRLVAATAQGDVPVVQAIAVVTGALFLVITISADAVARRFSLSGDRSSGRPS